MGSNPFSIRRWRGLDPLEHVVPDIVGILEDVRELRSTEWLPDDLTNHAAREQKTVLSEVPHHLAERTALQVEIEHATHGFLYLHVRILDPLATYRPDVADWRACHRIPLPRFGSFGRAKVPHPIQVVHPPPEPFEMQTEKLEQVLGGSINQSPIRLQQDTGAGRDLEEAGSVEGVAADP